MKKTKLVIASDGRNIGISTAIYWLSMTRVPVEKEGVTIYGV